MIGRGPRGPLGQQAVSYPISLARPAVSHQRPSGSELSAGNAYRSLGAAIIVAPVHWDAGANRWAEPTTPYEIDGLLCRHTVDPGEDGADTGAVITGRAEVADASIRYGDLDVTETNARLRELGILVREAVLPPD